MDVWSVGWVVGCSVGLLFGSLVVCLFGWLVCVCVCVNLATEGWKLAKISVHHSDSAVVPSPVGSRLVSD